MLIIKEENRNSPINYIEPIMLTQSETPSTIQMTINQMDGTQHIITVAKPSNLDSVKIAFTQATGLTDQYYKFYIQDCEDSLLGEHLFSEDTVLFALPFNPIPDNETLKVFVKKILRTGSIPDKSQKSDIQIKNAADWPYC